MLQLKIDNEETNYDYRDGAGTLKWFAPETKKQYAVYTAFQELRAMMKVCGHVWHVASFTLDHSGWFRIEFKLE